MSGITKTFKVIAISDNANSFGLKHFVAIARDGHVFKACANSLNIPEYRSEVQIEVRLYHLGEGSKEYVPSGAKYGFELLEDQGYTTTGLAESMWKEELCGTEEV